uniref:Uncharacterized protein n=1 Tax=Ditylenchus dipsaci TaxID=166011 RepID=A0A915ET99_9BILA
MENALGGQLQQEMIEMLEKREEFGRTDVSYLMQLMDPSNRGQSLTEEEKQAGIEVLANKMHVDMISQVVYIKHNLHLEYAHLFKSGGKDAEVDEAEENLVEESEQENEIGEEMYMFD